MTAPPDPAAVLARHLAERGPWCAGFGRHPHAVPPEDLEAVGDGTVLCALCAARRGADAGGITRPADGGGPR